MNHAVKQDPSSATRCTVSFALGLALSGTLLIGALRWLVIDGAPGAVGILLDAVFAGVFVLLVRGAGASRAQAAAAVAIWLLLFQMAHILKLSALGSPVFFSDIFTLGVLASVLKTWQVVLAAVTVLLLAGVLLYSVWPTRLRRLPWSIAALLLPFALYYGAPWEARIVDAVLPAPASDYVTHLQRRGGMQFLLDQRARKYELALKGRNVLAGLRLDERPQLAARRNVHLVLLETFWDPRALKAFQFDRDPFDPRFRAMLEQGGNSAVMTPHFGHLTANAEFEALCGLPATEDAVFQSRLKDVLPCLPRLLRELGYETLASHTNHQDSWGRDTAYKYMGFAQFNAYQSFVRDDLDGVFLNDASFFRQNREVLARTDRSTPHFNYLVTISSHYPYQLNHERRPPLVQVTPANAVVQNYADALAYSSKAFMDWVEAVRADDPDALIVAFGDHAPAMPPDQAPYAMSGINTSSRPFDGADTLVAMSRTPLLFIDGRKGAVDVGTMPLEFLPVAITRALGVIPGRLPYLTDDMVSQRAHDSTRFLGNVLTRDNGQWQLCREAPAKGTACAEAVQLYDRKRALRNVLLAESRANFNALGGAWLNMATPMQFGSGECLLEVSDWGPKDAIAGVPFNKQKESGLSATWMKVARIQGSPQLRIGAVTTPVVGSGDILAGLWPAPSVINQAGSQPVQVICGGKVVNVLGDMQVRAAPSAARAMPATVTGPLKVVLEGQGMASVSATAVSGQCTAQGMQQGVVRVQWSRTPVAGDGGMRVLIEQEGGERQLWSASGPGGESTTGPWATENLKLWFEDAGGGELGSAVLSAPSCMVEPS